MTNNKQRATRSSNERVEVEIEKGMGQKDVLGHLLSTFSILQFRRAGYLRHGACSQFLLCNSAILVGPGA